MTHWMRRMGVAVVVIGVSLARLGAATTAAEVLAQRKQLDEGPRHWRDRERHMTLSLERSAGAAEQRQLVTYERQLPGDEEQAILFFEAPAAIRGVGLLSMSHPTRQDEQWVYLPALKRSRQIGTSRSARQERFADTDLTFLDLDLLRDMTSWTESEAPSTLLGEETVDDVATYRIERKPVLPDVYYARVVLWIGTDDLVTRRVEFFESGTDPVKRIAESDIRTVDGIPVAHRLEAVTPAEGTRTVMNVTSIRFNQGLEDGLFTQRALARGKR